jgi:hypothetical protein
VIEDDLSSARIGKGRRAMMIKMISFRIRTNDTTQCAEKSSVTMLLLGHPSAIEKNLFITDEHGCGKLIKALYPPLSAAKSLP